MDIFVNKSNIKGEIKAPPSKSYAHRLIIASFLSRESVKIHNVGTSLDILATLNCLQNLGLNYKLKNGNVQLNYSGLKSGAILDCNESGSTLRFLLPIVCALGVKAKFTGKERLLNRPISELVNSLNDKGANVQNLEVLGKLDSGVFKIDSTISSQFITGLLFALPLLDGDSKIIFDKKPVSKNYIDITLNVLKKFNIKIEKLTNGYYVKGNQKYIAPKKIVTEGDYSGASFPLILGAINGEVTVLNLNKNSKQGDKQIIKILKLFGANVESVKGGYKVSSLRLNPININAKNIPDIVQPISVVCAFCSGKSVIKNVSRLKDKESDRISGIINNLNRAGIKAEYTGKDLIIYGGSPLRSEFLGENDHRTVMSAICLSLNVLGESKILGVEAINKSYPNFLEDIQKLGGNISG